MQKFLIIQTAFIGDVVLATCLIEKLHRHYPDAQIDFLLRKGNESLLTHHPWIHEVLVWDKKKNKQQNLLKLIFRIRKEKYDKLINVQRFAATGLLTILSGAGQTIGFDKNPLAVFFDIKIKHEVNGIGGSIHEIERNLSLIRTFTDDSVVKPALYPSRQDYEVVRSYKQGNYIIIAPASVWFTKQYPVEQWISFIQKVPDNCLIYLIGASADFALCESIQIACPQKTVVNLCGKLSFLQSAALMRDAGMNYVNDSAPLHFASAMNAPVTAIYCSTIPAFGFGPLSDKQFIVEFPEKLDCRPCGLHGYKACPLGHFHCARKISDDQLFSTLP